MAELDSGLASSRPIPAWTQLLAVAWMRWRMFANGFRRQRLGVGLALVILVRLIVWPMLALVALGPIIGFGFAGWMVISDNHPQRLVPLLAGITVLWQFVSINGVSIAATVSNFDPSSLVRFPLPFGRYLVLRTLLGLMTPSTIIGCLSLLAAAIGIGIADHRLALPALIVLGIYAAMNVFFSRMLAAWLERWLSTRRAREIFGVLMAFFFIGVQFLNFRRVGSHPHSHAVANSWMLNLMHGTYRFLDWLPPGFAANAIVLQGHPVTALAQFAALLAWTALFLAVFAMRLHKQFLGEYLSEGAARSAPAAPASAMRRPAPRPVAATAPAPAPGRTLLSPVIAAILRKEWVYLRGNANLLIGMLTPLILVFILGRQLASTHSDYLLPGALGYALFGVLAGLYNIFGADAAGMQLYLLAPIRLRDVVVAKNLMSLSVIAVDVTLAWMVVLILARSPIPLSTQVSAFFWIVFVIAANLTLGTLRSIQAPRKFVPGQSRQMRTPTNRTSGLLVLAVLFGSILLQVPVTLACRSFHQPWLAALIFAPLAGAAVVAYAMLLRNADQLILSHRDLIAEELCGT